MGHTHAGTGSSGVLLHVTNLLAATAAAAAATPLLKRCAVQPCILSPAPSSTPHSAEATTRANLEKASNKHEHVVHDTFPNTIFDPDQATKNTAEELNQQDADNQAYAAGHQEGRGPLIGQTTSERRC